MQWLINGVNNYINPLTTYKRGIMKTYQGYIKVTHSFDVQAESKEEAEEKVRWGQYETDICHHKNGGEIQFMDIIESLNGEIK
jgi:hypothetical protein